MKKLKGHGEITVYDNNIAYIPKQVVDELGKKLAYILNSRTILLFNPDTDPDLLLKAINALKNHISLRVQEVAQEGAQEVT